MTQQYEYEHKGLCKGVSHTFWSPYKDASKVESPSFDGERWLILCLPTGNRREVKTL